MKVMQRSWVRVLSRGLTYNRRYVKFFSPNGYFALQILGLGKREFSKKGLYFTYTLLILFVRPQPFGRALINAIFLFA
jgi:hypothetical protein